MLYFSLVLVNKHALLFFRLSHQEVFAGIGYFFSFLFEKFLCDKCLCNLSAADINWHSSSKTCAGYHAILTSSRQMVLVRTWPQLNFQNFHWLSVNELFWYYLPCTLSLTTDPSWFHLDNHRVREHSSRTLRMVWHSHCYAHCTLHHCCTYRKMRTPTG